MSSAAEAEVGAMFLNVREATPITKCLENMGHLQPPTPMIVDNCTAIGVVDTTMKQRQYIKYLTKTKTGSETGCSEDNLIITAEMENSI